MLNCVCNRDTPLIGAYTMRNAAAFKPYNTYSCVMSIVACNK